MTPYSRPSASAEAAVIFMGGVYAQLALVVHGQSRAQLAGHPSLSDHLQGGRKGVLIAQSQMDENGEARRARQVPKCSEWVGTADALSHSQVTLGWAERNI